MRDSVSQGWALSALIAAQILGSTAAGVTITAGAVTTSALAEGTLAAGAAQAASITGAAALSLPVASVAARWGRSYSLALAYGVAAAGGIVAAVGVTCVSLSVFIVGMIGVGGGTVGGLALRFAAAELAPQTRLKARNIALVLWSATIGSLVGPNLLAQTETLGRSGPFLVIASLYVASGLLSASAPFPDLRLPAPARRASRRISLQRVRRLGPDVRSALRVSTTGHMSMIASMGMAPVFLGQHMTIHAEGIGLIMSSHLAAMYAASPIFGALVRLVGAPIAGRAALCATILSCALLAAGSAVPVAFATGLILLGFAWSLGMIASSTRLASLAPQRRVDAQGFADLLLNVGGGLASVLAGLLMSWAGYPAPVVCIGAAASVVLLTDARAAALSARGRRAPARPGDR